MAFGASRPAVRDRKQAGCCKQYRDRTRRARAAGWLYVPRGRHVERNQRDTLHNNLNFNFVRDFAPVASMVRSPYVMVVNPSVPAKTVPEFIAYAKANPSKINMASAGIGSTNHVFGELFKTMAGIDLVHVPYRGNYLPDLLAGHVQVAFAPLPSSMEFIKNQRTLRALAVTTATRLDVLPDVSTVGDFLSGYEASSWTVSSRPKTLPPTSSMR